VADSEPSQRGQSGSELLPGGLDQHLGFGDPEDQVPAELRDVSFPFSVRGYNRLAVDAYVKRVNRVLAELEMSRSTEAAVKHALDRVGEKTSGILQRALTAAEEITAGAREEAEEATARARAEEEQLVASARAEAAELVANARAEAQEILARSRAEAGERVRQSEEEVAALREQADTWMRQLHADTEAISEKRGKLLSDIGELGARFEEVVRWAASRFSPAEAVEGAEEGFVGGDKVEAEGETEPIAVSATHEPMGAMPAAGSHEGGDHEPHHGEAEGTPSAPKS